MNGLYDTPAKEDSSKYAAFEYTIPQRLTLILQLTLHGDSDYLAPTKARSSALLRWRRSFSSPPLRRESAMELLRVSML